MTTEGLTLPAVLAMRRMERDRERAAVPERPVSHPAVSPAVEALVSAESPADLTLEDVDAFELKPNIFGIGINFNHLIKRIGAWRKQRRNKKS